MDSSLDDLTDRDQGGRMISDLTLNGDTEAPNEDVASSGNETSIHADAEEGATGSSHTSIEDLPADYRSYKDPRSRRTLVGGEEQEQPLPNTYLQYKDPRGFSERQVRSRNDYHDHHDDDDSLDYKDQGLMLVECTPATSADSDQHDNDRIRVPMANAVLLELPSSPTVAATPMVEDPEDPIQSPRLARRDEGDASAYMEVDDEPTSFWSRKVLYRHGLAYTIAMAVVIVAAALIAWLLGFFSSSETAYQTQTSAPFLSTFQPNLSPI